VSLLSSYCTYCIGQQLVLYLALLSCSLCSAKLHAVLLFEQINKEERKELYNLRVSAVGDHQIDVSYFGQTVQSSPFTAKVWDASKVIVAPIAAARVGVQSSFCSMFNRALWLLEQS